jgi:hypothetical protein
MQEFGCREWPGAVSNPDGGFPMTFRHALGIPRWQLAAIFVFVTGVLSGCQQVASYRAHRQLLYIVDSDRGSFDSHERVFAVDPERKQIIRNHATGARPDIALSPDGTRLYVASESRVPEGPKGAGPGSWMLSIPRQARLWLPLPTVTAGSRWGPCMVLTWRFLPTGIGCTFTRARPDRSTPCPNLSRYSILPLTNSCRCDPALEVWRVPPGALAERAGAISVVLCYRRRADYAVQRSRHPHDGSAGGHRHTSRFWAHAVGNCIRVGRE